LGLSVPWFSDCWQDREVLEETQREIVKGDAATMGRIDDKKSLLSGLHS